LIGQKGVGDEDDRARKSHARAFVGGLVMKAGLLKFCLAGLFVLGPALGMGLRVAAQDTISADENIITLQDADIRAFIDDVSMLTRKTFIVDPRVQGKVTISSHEALSPDEVFRVFQDVLRVHGFTAIPTVNGEYRITLIQGAAQDAPMTNGRGTAGQLSTIVIKLANTDAAEAARLIKPVLHPQGKLTANPGGNILVITDFPENLKKARAIVARLDLDDLEMQTVHLQNIRALDAERALRDVQGPKPKVRLVSVPGSNALVLQGKGQDIAKLLPVIRALDAQDSQPRGAVSVIALRFASGADLAEILQSLLPSYTRDGQPVPSVAHEPGSNSIIISAAPDVQASLEAIIHQLDVRRPQVLVEAIIVEISDTAAQELGVQFALAGANSDVPFISSNFSRSAPNLLALTGALAGDQFGLSDASRQTLETAAVNSLLGTNGGTFGGVSKGRDGLFGLIVNAIKADKDSNILSTPFVTTLDNVPARFLVGQEIPITTGESLGASNINPFRTFERKEVGVKLNVLPQISEGDVIRLSISQEVSSIAGAISTVSNDFVTNKREIETTVLANDGEIIVLGGLIQDDEQIEDDRVPVLGDLPGIGALFRSTGRSRVRTNLMVFLRPTIIRNAEDARRATERRMGQIRAEDLQQSGRDRSKIDEVMGEQ
jgi:general secretion pathway protein D